MNIKHNFSIVKNRIKRNRFLYFLILKFYKWTNYKFWRKIAARIKLRLISYSIVLFLVGYKIYVKIFQKNLSNNIVTVLVSNKFKMGESGANGSNKDIESMLEELHNNGIKFIVLPISKNPYFAIYEIFFKLKRINQLLLSRYILISIPGSISKLLFVLRLICRAKITVRTHNAELFHRLDYMRTTKKFWKKVNFLLISFRGLFSDFVITFFADNLLCISDYEIDFYWNKLNPFMKKSFVFFPYKPPAWIRRNNSERKHALILGSFDNNTLTGKPTIEFLSAAYSLNLFADRNNLELVSVGNFLNSSFNYRYLDSTDNLLDLLNLTKVLIIPSEYGWGFKTKIGDALFLNQEVIVLRQLYNKCGMWKNYLIAIDDWSKIDTVKIGKNVNNYSLIGDINRCRTNSILSVFSKNH